MIRKIAYKIVQVMYKSMISIVFFVQKSLSVTHNHQSDYQKIQHLIKVKLEEIQTIDTMQYFQT